MIGEITDQGYIVTYDPPGDGNCQFLALCDSLLIFGIFWSPQTLREEIVNYLISIESINGEVVRDFSSIPWDDYIQQMDIEGTYGDELTLRACENISNIEIEIVSTLGNDDWVSINQENSNRLGQITLRHFAEGQGDHYVCIQREIAEDDETQQQDLDNIADNIVENNAEEIIPIRDEAKEVASLEALLIEIVEKIFLHYLTTSSFKFPNHVCWTYKNAINALPVFKSFQQMGLIHLPRIYINACDYLPKPRKSGELVVNIQRLIRNFGSASGIVTEVKVVKLSWHSYGSKDSKIIFAPKIWGILPISNKKKEFYHVLDMII